MRNLKLVVEYDGTEFHGFQKQAGLRTVQGVLEERFSRLLSEPIKIIGAGRTDAGVHATGQVVNFYTTRPLVLDNIIAVLNRTLPVDVQVQHAAAVGPEFHARRSARRRTYEYTILERDQPSPLLGRYAWIVSEPLRVMRIARAARLLVGQHDFRAFQSGGAETKSTERVLYRLTCRRKAEHVMITAEADAFLYQMVRLLVGTLVNVSRGELEIDEVAEILAEGNRRRLPAPAPACGLCLVQVSYASRHTRRTD